MKRWKRFLGGIAIGAITFGGCVALSTVKPIAVTNAAANSYPVREENMQPAGDIEIIPEVMTYYAVPLEPSLQEKIILACQEREIDPAVIIAMIERESSYKADAIGDNGNSFGLMQIQPRWHYQRMVELDCTDLLDPYQNITVGIDFLDELLDKYSLEEALTAYNSGSPGQSKYADEVMSRAESLR